ncbi:amidohydrolase family protein [Massilia sp. RP-1-19]|uniref:Amidohydrolase family protein n=1 Tax=Massilia polaris TaxID=2728846 RepID=A0A848HNI1_9BURK|nr:CIA30 family protein [Massilia polaris]NML61689.1 amidohydrolase family protein [Massilia polaris]
MKTITVKAILSMCVLACPAAAFAAATLVQDVRVFDGKQVHPKRSVLIENGVIANADYRGAAPAGARVVSGAGRTLLPGLIDAHVHAYRHFELPLLFGVTTQVDMFTGVQAMQQITRAMAAGENRDQADLFSAGTLVTAAGGHGTQFGMPIPTLAKPAEAQAFVDARIAEGSHFIKIVLEEGHGEHKMQSLDLATVKAAIDAAHRRGKLAVVHISTLANARAALDAGADGLVHLFIGDRIGQQEAAAFARLARAKDAFVIPTFTVLESSAGVRVPPVGADSPLAGLLDKEQQVPLTSSYGPKPMPEKLAVPKTVTAALHKAGVVVLAGTDAGNPGTQYGISMHRELAALVEAGLSPQAALAAATSAPAAAFRLGKRGRIANGYKADLLLVNGNPLTDISATQQIEEIWKDGESVSALRAKQRQRVAQELVPSPENRVRLPGDGRISLFTAEKFGSPVGTGWGPSHDGMMGGSSTVKLALLPAAAEGQAGVSIDATVAPGFPYPWAGVAFMPGARPMQAADLSGAKLIRFRVRGDGQRYQLMMMSTGVTIPATVPFTAGADWAEVTVPFSAMPGIDPAAVTMIGFNAGPKLGGYRFELADVRLLER